MAIWRLSQALKIGLTLENQPMLIYRINKVQKKDQELGLWLSGRALT